MTTLATGGFSNYNESIGFFDSISIEVSSMIFIILGSIPFIAYIKFISGNKKIFIKDSQIKFFFGVIIFSIIILTLYLLINKSEELSLRSIFFNVISILTGTGYSSNDFSNWGGYGTVIMMIIMFETTKSIPF